MKILTIAATPFFSDRGSHIRIFNEAKNLQRLGAQVTLCAYHFGRTPSGLSVQRISRSDWYRKTSPGFSWGKIWLDLKLIFLVAREMKKDRPDIIHAHLFEGLGVAFAARFLVKISDWKRRKRIPIVLDSQGDLEKEFETYNRGQMLAKKIFVFLSKKIISRADAVVASSENALKSFPSATLVRDGIWADFFSQPEPVDEETQKELAEIQRWREGKKLLIYAGGVDPGKGIEELAAFWNREKMALSGWKLVIFGLGERRRQLAEKYASTRRGKDGFSSDRFWLAGGHSYFSLPHYLKMSTASIDPKKDSTESSGKLPGYMAAGLPVVCFDNLFNRTRLGQNGFYLTRIEQLPDCLSRLENIGQVRYNEEAIDSLKEAKRLLKVMERLARGA